MEMFDVLTKINYKINEIKFFIRQNQELKGSKNRKKEM